MIMSKLKFMTRMLAIALLAATLTDLTSSFARAQSAGEDGIDVRVEFKNDVIHIDVMVPVAASPQEVWDVITDYDGAERFITNLKTSTIDSRNGNTWVVSQEMIAKVGPFSTSINTVRELQLTPYELIRSRMIRGNMKRADSITRVVTDGSITRIVMHSESVPDFWLPGFMGRGFIERSTREQFVNLRNEILRRKKPVIEKTANQ
jgi:uncharacterized protein YndB with AHSA1/START domain